MVIFHSGTNAQRNAFTQYTTTDGLPSSTIYFLHEDREGFLWIATNNGVSRYDGQNFENFTTASGLTDNDVLMIKEDSKGRIWFLTFNGIPCFFERGKFHHPGNHPALKGIQSGKRMTSVHETARGEILLSFYAAGVRRINFETNENEIIHKDLKPVMVFRDDENRDVFFEKSSMIFEFTGKEFLPYSILGLGPEFRYVPGPSRSLMDGKDNFLISSHNLFQIKNRKFILLKDLLPMVGTSYINHFSRDSDGDFWIGTSSGLLHLKKKRPE